MSSEHYYTRQGRRILGPFDLERLQRLASLGRFSRGHQVSTDRVTWFPASELTEVFGEAPSSARDAVPAAPAGTEFPDSVGPEYSPRPKGSGMRLALWIGIPVAVLFMAVIGVGAVWYFSDVISDGATGRNMAIVGIDDDEKLQDAIGFLVTGKRYVTKDGRVIEEVHGFGTCFLISPDGYALTNKHVIEQTRQLERAKNKLKTEREKYKLEDVEPIVLAFFDGKSYPAEIRYVSDDYDMAIVKVEKKRARFFTLSETEVDRRSKVWAFGFPGAAINKSAIREKVLKAIRGSGDVRMKQSFSREDFKYTSTGGAVSRVFTMEKDGNMIQHDAPINKGNSGGPLVSEEGIVFGINTLVARDSQGIFFSLTLEQLRAQIDEHVPNVVWK